MYLLWHIISLDLLIFFGHWFLWNCCLLNGVLTVHVPKKDNAYLDGTVHVGKEVQTIQRYKLEPYMWEKRYKPVTGTVHVGKCFLLLSWLALEIFPPKDVSKCLIITVQQASPQWHILTHLENDSSSWLSRKSFPSLINFVEEMAILFFFYREAREKKRFRNKSDKSSCVSYQQWQTSLVYCN